MAKIKIVKKTSPVKAEKVITLRQERHQRLSKRYKKAFIISLLANLLLTTIILGMFYFKG